MLVACAAPTPRLTANSTTFETAPAPEAITEESPKWTQEELEGIAQTLAGECYDDNEHDKRLTCEVILNRVSSNGFGDTIIAVLTAKHQFEGYWSQSRPVSENDYAVAEKALEDWYANDCQPLSEYLFFAAGANQKNEFRKEF